MIRNQKSCPQKVTSQFFNLGSTSIYISHCIYHTFSLSVGTLLSSKAHTSPEPCIHSDLYCVGSALRIIAHTTVHTLSEQLCSILDQDMSTFSHHAMQIWASPSLLVIGGAIYCESTTLPHRSRNCQKIAMFHSITQKLSYVALAGPFHVRVWSRHK